MRVLDGKHHAVFFLKLKLLSPRAGSGVDRIDPVHLLAGYRKRRLNQALSPLLALVFCVCSFVLFIRATFCVSFAFLCVLSFGCYGQVVSTCQVIV